MAKYLIIGSYTPEGAAGILKEGGSGRVQAARQIVESVGGTFEALYWGFGADDWYLLADFPSYAAVAAASLTAGASGTSRSRTVVLMSADDIDAASHTAVTFRPPGT